MKKLFVAIIILILTTSGCAHNSKSWAYQFVTYNGNTYIVTDQKVSNVDKEIGSIKYCSTDEHDFKDSFFSNYYSEGTLIYSIKDISVNDAISAKNSDNEYIKLVNKNTK